MATAEEVVEMLQLALQKAAEKAAEVAERVWSWGECREETAVAAALTFLAGLLVMVVVIG